MSDWQFIRPWWLVALVAVPVLVWLYRQRHFAAGRWADVVDLALQPFVLSDAQDAPRRRWLPWLFGALLALLIVALAGPVRERLPQPVYRDTSALIIALDLSQSMNARDVLPTRLTRAHLKIRDLLSKRTEGDTALLVFAGDAFTVTPLTDDTATIESLLASLTTDLMSRQGSLIAPALARAERLLEDAGAEHGRVLVLTDGVADRPAAEQAAQQLARRGFPVSVLGIGTPQGDVVRRTDGELVKDSNGQIVVATTDVAALASVSAAGNGRFALLSADDSDLDALLGAGEAMFADGVLNEDMQTDVWKEEGPLLVLLCLPLIALMFRRGWIMGLAVIMFMPPPPAHAGVWQDLWVNRNQQGVDKYQAQEFAPATELFVDPQWRAAAAFRAGDYAQSAAALDGIDTATAHYNRGNALARAGDIDAAKAAYDAALALNPDHEDARFNRALLEQLPPPPQDQNQSADGEDGESDQDGDAGESGADAAGDQPGEQPPQPGEGDQQADSNNEDGTPDGESQAGEGDQQSDDASQAEQQQAQEAEQEPGDAEGDRQAQALSEADQEMDLAAEQWLRQVPDDPGGLLRRKFERQYRLRYQGQPQEPQEW